jgi:hypothetical protein
MPEQVTCPACQQLLRIRDDVTTAKITCPRCLALVDRPQAAEPPPATYDVQPAERTTPIRHCPRCMRQVEPRWRFCPYCETALTGPQRGRPIHSADNDAAADLRGIGWGVIVLAVFGVLGLGQAVMSGVMVIGQGQRGAGIVYLTMVGAFFVACFAVAAYRSRGYQDAMQRTAVGTLANAGIACLTLSALGTASVIFLFAICLAGGIVGR